MVSILTETLTPAVSRLSESRVGGQLYLRGIVMQAECVNGNKRRYSNPEITQAVAEAMARIKEGNYVLGELNHPDNLSIDLSNVSHAITEMHMDGNDAIGNLKILNTPSGNIARGLIEGGVRLGVSSRGSGSVSESGDVSGFSMLTCDLVANPSAPNAYPNAVYEAKNNTKILSLAEAVTHDPRAQAYFKKEMASFIQAIFKK